MSACSPLLAWVIENLIKNAVDAMDGSGSIDVKVGNTPVCAFIEVVRILSHVAGVSTASDCAAGSSREGPLADKPPHNSRQKKVSKGFFIARNG